MRVFLYATAMILVAFSTQVFAQQNSVSIGTNQVNPKAVLWLVPNSGGQGLLLPVVTSSVRTGMGLQATDRGMIVYDGTDNSVYLWNGTSWASLAGGGSTTFTGANGITITGNTISTDAIRPTTLATGDLTGTFASPQIANNAVTTGKIANNAVDDSKIAGVSPAKIAQASATNGQVLKWNGTAWAPADDASAAVTAGAGISIAGNVISNTGLLTTSTAGGDLTGTFANLQIAGGTVTSIELADNAVTTAKLADNSVTNAKIASGVAVNKLAPGTNGQVLTVSGGVATWQAAPGGTVPTLSNGQILTGDGTTNAATALTGDATLAGGALTIANNAVTTAKLATDAVTTAKILDANVTNAKLAANAVDASKIADGSVTGADLATNIAITTTGNIAAANFTGNGSGLTGITVADGSITGGVGSGAKLAPNTITDANVSPTANIAATKLATTVVLDTEAPTGGEVSGNFATGLTINANAVTDTKLATGIDAAKITTGVLPVAQVPNLDAAKITTGTLPVVRGGTGITAVTPGGIAYGGATNFAFTPAGTAGQFLQSNGAAAPTWTTFTGWSLLGNAGTNPATNYIGTSDAQPLRFATGGTERMRFDNLGNTGIGTTTPGARLHIKQSVQVNEFATDGGQGYYGGGLFMENVGTTDGYYMGYSWSGNFAIGHRSGAGVFTRMMSVTPQGSMALASSLAPLSVLDVNGDVRLAQTTAPSTTTDKLYNVGGSLFWNGTNISSGGSGWSLSGNAGTNPATNFMGTTDAQPVVFRSNNLERIRIDSDGNVGIGQSTPTAKLDILGGVLRVATTISGPGSQSLSQMDDPINGLLGSAGLVGHFAGDHYLRGSWGLKFDRYNNGEVNPSSGNYFGGNPDAGSATFRYWTGSSWRTDMVIRGSGNVGIGTLNPLSKLDVSGDVRLAQTTAPSTTTDKLYNVGGNLFWNGTNISGGGSGWSLSGNTGTNPATNFMGTTDAQPMVFRTNNLERVRIDENGNVAIGNNAPRSMLELNSLTSDQGMLRLISGSDNVGSTGIMFGRYAISERNAKTAIMMHQSVNGDWRRGDLVFALNGAPDFSEVSLADEKMRITFGGNVGIGVTNPASKLQLAGDLGLAPMTAPSTTTDKLYNVGGNLFWNGINISGSSGWGLTGNTGTVDGTNFIGTTDNVPLTFRVNNQRSARIESATATANTFFGYQTGVVNTGVFNAAMGYQAMQDNTTGERNAAFGNQAMANNTTGNGNTAMGHTALGSNLTGGANTAIGTRALFNNTASNNTAVGNGVLSSNVTGTDNAALGLLALTATTGSENAGLGAYVLQSNTTGNQNTAIGANAGLSSITANANTTGSRNTFIGYASGPGTTTQLTNATAIGSNAAVTASNSLVLGSISGVNGATSNTNVGIGTTAPASRLDIVGDVRLAQITAPGVTTDKLYNVGGSLFWNGTNLSAGSTSWGLTGNAGTVDGTSFIGTTDNVPLTFRVNNQRGGRIESSGTTANTFFGYLAGSVNTGLFNVAVGHSAMSLNTSGQGNAAFGYRALTSNTTGNGNTSIGASSLAINTTGYGNTAIGSSALNKVVIGYDNTAVGQQALFNSTGNANLAVGSQAATLLTTGNDNAALGSGALFNTTTGSTNTAVGNSSLSTNVTGSANTALGYNAEVATSGLTNATAIGANSQVAASNSLVLGSINGVNGATANTNVGIGIAAPVQRLHVADAGANQVYMRISNSSATNGLNIGLGGAGVQEAFIANNENAALYFQTNATNRMTISAAGSIGIGTISPSYPLDVSGSAAFTPTNAGEYLSSGQTLGVNAPRNITIRASNTILASSFLAISDKRIKTNIKLSNPASDLTTLMNLNVVDYDYIDRVKMGDVVQKGFIAQQVQEVYPDAVNVLKSGEFVPSIYSKAQKVNEANGILTIQLSKEHGLKVGDKVQIMSKDGAFKEVVTAVHNENTFEIRNASIPSEDLFVYGKQVNDFYTVDYDRIYTLGISAMQEMNRKLEAQQQIIDSLKARDAENQKKIAALEARLVQSSSADSELAALKAEIEKIKIAIGVSAEAAPVNKK